MIVPIKHELIFDRKSELPDKANELIKELKAKYYTQLKKIQCDDAGDNHELEMLQKKGENDITFEHTVPGMPQQNGHAEQSVQCCLAE